MMKTTLFNQKNLTRLIKHLVRNLPLETTNQSLILRRETVEII